jgi:hypothetical protein
MARPRLRAALVAAALLASSAPVVARALAPALTCGVTTSGYWERIPVKAFVPVNGLSSADTITAYTVDEQRPRDLAVTNGVRVHVSSTHGCAWQDSLALSPTPTAAQPFTGLQARIVSLGLLQGRRLAAVQEGSGAASRPHVMVQRPGGSWTTSDNGLPAQGAPRLLRTASDGRTAYLTISPTATGGSDGGPTTGVLPGLPGSGGVAGTSTGFLYRTADGGASWTLVTGAADLPAGGTGFSALDLDATDSNRLYGIVDGRLLVSRNGGASFTDFGAGYSTLTSAGPLTVVAFKTGGGGVYSSNGGGGFVAFPAPRGITSAAYRSGDSALVVESGGGSLQRLELNGRASAVPAGASPRAGSLLGDRGDQSSFHALAGHSVLRYVDPVPRGSVAPPLAVGDLSVPPPRPGVMRPAVRNVSLPVGSSSLEPFELDLPKNPTPLDLYFLVDVSGSMEGYIKELKANINGIVGSLEARKIDLRVGVGTIGTGPGEGETPWPPAYLSPPVPDAERPGETRPGPPYRKPRLYQRIRAVGSTGPSLQATVDALELESNPDGIGPKKPREGTLLALYAAATGRGIHTEAEDKARLDNTYTEVPPGLGAGFRGGKHVRKVIILATDEPFDVPYPQKSRPGGTLEDPRPEFDTALRALNAEGIQVIGLSASSTESLADLRTVSRGTSTFAPPGGTVCNDGSDGDVPETVPAGAPMVCSNGTGFADVIVRTLASLVDRQRVSLVTSTRTPVLGAIQGRALASVDVKQATRNPFSVRVTCVDVKPGRYTQEVVALLRQTKVGAARLNVTCVKAAAAVPPRPAAVPEANPPPPPAPVPNLVPPPVPAPPAAQPQVQPQVQTQVQVQPLTAGALQEQQELQLALALNGTLKDDDPVFSAGQQMAMVDRRKREQVQALGLLAFAVTACAGLGLARLRSRPEVQVRRAR